MAAGDFSATELGKIKVALKEIMPEIREEYSNIAIAKEVLSRQTANISLIERDRRCIGATIYYQVDCTDSVDDCDGIVTSCDWTAPEHESAKKDVTVNDCLTEAFTISEDECNGNTLKYRDKYVFRMATALGKIQEKLSEKAAAYLDANARTPVASTKYGTVPISPDNDQINFAESEWNLELISKMLYDARQNDIKRPYGVSTGLLWVEQNLNARKGAGCCTLDSANGGITIAYDTRFSQVADIVGEDALYLIDPNYFAFWTYNQFSNDTLRDKGHDALFVGRMKLPDLTYGRGRTPIYADLFRKRVCGSSIGDTVDKYLLKLPFGFFHAPDICSNGNTGILKFGVTSTGGGGSESESEGEGEA